MKTILFTNARDEDHILEWIVHHLGFDFTTIYIYDHKSIKPIKNISNNLPENVIIENINLDGAVKGILINKAIKYCKDNDYEWMLYLDADEFLYLKNNIIINDFLHNYKDYDEIGLNWLCFGSNYQDNETENTIIESYVRSEKNFNQLLKCFIKPQKVIKFNNPHFYIIEDMSKAVAVDLTKLNDNKSHLFINHSKFDNCDAFIAHYLVQSYETYKKRKVDRPRDDTGVNRTLKSKTEFHNSYNAIENNIMLKYNEANKRLLNYYNINN